MKIKGRMETIEILTFRLNGMCYRARLREHTQWDEEGNLIPHYDGAEKWYYIEKEIAETPYGQTAYGPDLKKAQAKMKRIAKTGRF